MPRCRRLPKEFSRVSLSALRIGGLGMNQNDDSSEIYQIGEAQFHALRDVMYRETGVSLGDAKRPLVCSRLARRLKTLGLTDYGEYLRYLQQGDARRSELQHLVNCLTTNKTDFFRENHHFEFLRDTVLPNLEAAARKGARKRLRIWSSACSQGDEPYSIAMTIMEHLPDWRSWDVRILASDINTDVLRIANEGIYPIAKIDRIDESYKRKYLLFGRGAKAGQVQIRPEVRSLISFRQINLVRQWPFRAPFDVIFCRNVIIYFDQVTQSRLLERMAEQLTPNGFLILGHSENPPWLKNYFDSRGHTIFEKCRKQPSVSNSVIAEPIIRSEAPTPTPSNPIATTSSSTSRMVKTAAASPRKFLAEHHADLPKHSVIAGQTCALETPGVISTILGSCVAVCLYDPVLKVGGMNHFMLPAKTNEQGASARYGLHAMELLITAIMKLGGQRHRLLAKAFGGADVLNMQSEFCQIGRKNVEFIRSFLKTEDFPLVAHKLGGNRPLRIHFQPHTGRVFVETVERASQLLQQEIQFGSEMIRKAAQPGDVVLFKK